MVNPPASHKGCERPESTLSRQGDYPKADVPELRAAIRTARTQRRLFQLLQQRLCFPQVLCVEAFGEPSVDWRQKAVCFLALALRLPQERKTGRRAELRGLRCRSRANRANVQPTASPSRREPVLLPLRQCLRMTDTTDTPTPLNLLL